MELKREDFDEREYAALAWTRDWATFRGEFPDQDVVDEFEKNYNEQERLDILGVVTVMDFANRFMNTTTGQTLYDPEATLKTIKKKN